MHLRLLRLLLAKQQCCCAQPLLLHLAQGCCQLLVSLFVESWMEWFQGLQ
jgi:hypothetical protein